MSQTCSKCQRINPPDAGLDRAQNDVSQAMFVGFTARQYGIDDGMGTYFRQIEAAHLGKRTQL